MFLQIRLKTWLVAALVGVAMGATTLASANPAVAQEQATQPRRQVTLSEGQLQGREAEDARLLDQAFETMQSGGYSALERLAPRLRRALERAPESYPVLRVEGSVIRVRGDLQDAIMLGALAMTANQGPDSPAAYEISTTPNVYPLISLLLGSLAVERGRYDEALRVMDKGLSIQPGYWMLLNERIVALQGLGRHDQALAAADAALSSGDIMVQSNAGMFHRKRGGSLIELNRLDDAEAAYTAALELDADDRVAQAQLEYIRQVRAGAPRNQMAIVRSQGETSQSPNP